MEVEQKKGATGLGDRLDKAEALIDELLLEIFNGWLPMQGYKNPVPTPPPRLPETLMTEIGRVVEGLTTAKQGVNQLREFTERRGR